MKKIRSLVLVRPRVFAIKLRHGYGDDTPWTDRRFETEIFGASVPASDGGLFWDVRSLFGPLPRCGAKSAAARLGHKWTGTWFPERWSVELFGSSHNRDSRHRRPGTACTFVTITVRHNQASAMPEFTQMAERALADDGFLELDAPGIGRSILELERRRFPLASEHGLDFIRQHILDDECITSIIDSVFPDGCVIGHFLRYQAYPGKAVSLWRRRGSEDKRHALVVHFLPMGSQVNYIRGSHLLELSFLKSGSRSLWEAPAPELLAETGYNSDIR
ncbi:hypothetical protein J7T55_012016 [Diaporthe amygdali]|uniref:uncharacterized protein n=1 Tax=Phomopsis amygdali TaxID=1214568 RepID=UPI0022FE623A|nr:uncharacterized protein J7T55_012016 [Diaporthe amygdali]KAJ0123551.1 hypothetical protein J7T55_012016 [Diaporthe amygdali]